MPFKRLDNLLVGTEELIKLVGYETEAIELRQDLLFRVGVATLAVRVCIGVRILESSLCLREVDLELLGPIVEAEKLGKVLRPRPFVHQVLDIEEPLGPEETHVEVLGGTNQVFDL